MNRRTCLAVAAGLAGLAGCLGRASEDPDDPGTDPSPPGTPDDGVQRRIELAAADRTGREYGVRIEATVVEPAVTAAHPARVRVRTINEGSKRKLSVSGGGCSLFNRTGGASEPPGLWLNPPSAAEHLDRRGDRWTRDAPADQPRAFAAYACLPATYEPGETVTNEYDVWDDYRVEGYLSPGTYRFEEPVAVHPADETPDSKPVAEFGWGFELRVTVP